MKKIIYTKKAPDPVGPYSQAIFVNSTLYISGQVAINPKTGKIENSNIEKVIHFADQHITNTNDYLGNSLRMLKNVLDACAINHTPLTIMSRWEVFSGLTNGVVEAKEDTRRCPAGVLGETKCLFEDLALRFLENEKVPVTIIRSALVYDENNMPNFMRRLIDRGKSGKEIQIHDYDNGFSAIDVIHANDWVSKMNGIIQSNDVGIFHIGGELLYLNHIAETASELGGGVSKISAIKIEGKVAKVALKTGRIISNLHSEPQNLWIDFVASLK